MSEIKKFKLIKYNWTCPHCKRAVRFTSLDLYKKVINNKIYLYIKCSKCGEEILLDTTTSFKKYDKIQLVKNLATASSATNEETTKIISDTSRTSVGTSIFK